jgi:hypothetical protein
MASFQFPRPPPERRPQADVRAMGAQLHRRHGGAEHGRRLLERQALPLDELERFAVRLRHARELALDGAGEALRMKDLVGAMALDGHRGALVAGHENLELAAPRLIDEEPAGDGERPGEHVGAGQEAAPRAMDVEQRLLEQIIGALAALAAQIAVQPRRQGVVERREGRVVAARVPLHRRVRGRALGVPLAPHLHRLGARKERHVDAEGGGGGE